MKTNEQKLLRKIRAGAEDLKKRINDPGESITIPELKIFARAWQKNLLRYDQARKIAAKFPLRSLSKHTPEYVRQFLIVHQG